MVLLNAISTSGIKAGAYMLIIEDNQQVQNFKLLQINRFSLLNDFGKIDFQG